MDAASLDTIQPTGLGAALLGVTLAFTILCPIITGLRVWTRMNNRAMGDDDYLMIVGLVFNVVHNSVVMRGTFYGLGAWDSQTNSATKMEGKKYVFLWQLFYAIDLAFVKTSILATMKRIATAKVYLRIIWGLIILSAAISTAGVVVILINCKPIAANWDSSLGSCISPVFFVILSKLASVVNMISDLSVAIIPVFLLRDVQMKRSLKIVTNMLLGLGVLASIASIIRIPYTDAYSTDTNSLHNIGNIVLWTVIECGLGIIAGSLPMLRHVIKSFRTENKSSYVLSGRHTELANIGGSRARENPNAQYEVRCTISGRIEENPESESIYVEGEQDSTRGIIKVTRAVEQTWAKPQGYEKM